MCSIITIIIVVVVQRVTTTTPHKRITLRNLNATAPQSPIELLLLLLFRQLAAVLSRGMLPVVEEETFAEFSRWWEPVI